MCEYSWDHSVLRVFPVLPKLVDIPVMPGRDPSINNAHEIEHSKSSLCTFFWLAIWWDSLLVMKGANGRGMMINLCLSEMLVGETLLIDARLRTWRAPYCVRSVAAPARANGRVPTSNCVTYIMSYSASNYVPYKLERS